MTSRKVFVPFWVVLEYLDSAQYPPFIECTVLKEYEAKSEIQALQGEESIIKMSLLEIKEHLTAEIPTTYTIEENELENWANKLADWIKDFPKEIAERKK